MINNKKILLTGSTGMLGDSLLKVFNKKNVYGISRTFNKNLQNQFVFNLSDFRNIKKFLKNFVPDVIIHTAANVSLKRCEEEKKSTYDLHVNSTKELAKIFPNAKFIYISTDSIFNGLENSYNESSIPNPMNYYSKTKFLGECEVLQNSNYPNIIRTNIIGQNKKQSSFSDWIINELSKKNEISGYKNIFFNPIHVDILSNIIYKIIFEIELNEKILNVGSLEKISKYDYICLVAKKFDFSFKLINGCKIDKFSDGIDRPFNTFLETKMFDKIFNKTFSINESIEKLNIK